MTWPDLCDSSSLGSVSPEAINLMASHGSQNGPNRPSQNQAQCTADELSANGHGRVFPDCCMNRHSAFTLRDCPQTSGPPIQAFNYGQHATHCKR